MTVTPQPMTATPDLAAALERLRVEGAIYLRADLSEPWSYESAPAGMATVLRPGAERLVLFHLVTEAELASIPGVFVHRDLQSNSSELVRLFRQADAFVLPTLADFSPQAAPSSSRRG